MSRTIVNINSNLVLLVVNMCVTFIMTPVLIKNMGDHDYGIFALAVSIVGYMSILDLGLSPAISRFISKFSSEKNHESTQAYFTVALKLLTAIGVLAAIIMLIVYLISPQLLAPADVSYDKDYSYVMILMTLQILFTFPRVCLISTLQGRNLYTVNNNVSIFISIIATTFIVSFISENNGLVLVFSVGLATGLIKTLYFYLYITEILKIKIKRLSFKEFRHISSELIHFSSRSFVQGTSARLSYHSDNIIITGFLNASYIVTYSLPVALLQYVSLIVGNITTVFLPLFTDMYVRNDNKKLIDVYMSSTRIISSISFFGVGAVFILGDNFISMWISDVHAERAATLIPYLALNGLFYLFNPLDNMLVTSQGRHGYFAKISTYQVIANIGLSVILINYMGLLGVAIGTLLSTVGAEIFKTIYCSKLLGIKLARLCLEPIRPIIIPCLIPLCVMFILDGYATSIINFVLICISLTSAWLFLTYQYALKNEERDLIHKMIWKIP